MSVLIDHRAPPRRQGHADKSALPRSQPLDTREIEHRAVRQHPTQAAVGGGAEFVAWLGCSDIARNSYITAERAASILEAQNPLRCLSGCEATRRCRGWSLGKGERPRTR